MENYGERSGDAQDTTQYAKEVQLLLQEYVRQHSTAAADKQVACHTQPACTLQSFTERIQYISTSSSQQGETGLQTHTTGDIPDLMLMLPLRTNCKLVGSVGNAVQL
jgi:hypothetical protein